MGIVGKELGASVKLRCPACKLPVHIVVTTFEEDICTCPYCGCSLMDDDFPGDITSYIERMETALEAWHHRSRGPRHHYGLELKQAADDLADKLFRTNYDDSATGDQKPRPAALEHTLISVAEQRLTELDSLVKEHDEIADVRARFSELTGLTELAKLQDSGLSEHTVKRLDSIDQAALKLMRDLANK